MSKFEEAVLDNNIKLVRQYLSKPKFKVESQNLVSAASKGYTEMVELLLSSGKVPGS